MHSEEEHLLEGVRGRHCLGNRGSKRGLLRRD